MSTIEDVRKKMREEVREKIYNIALDLFIKNGYENTTIASICQKAGIAKGTFFNYFPSKDDILTQYYSDLTFTSLNKAKAKKHKDHRSAIIFYITDIARRAIKHPDLYLSLNQVKASSNSLIDEENILDNEFLEFSIKHVEEGMKDGEINDKYDAKIMAELLLSIATGTANEWRNSDKSWDLVETLKDRMNYLFYMAEPKV